MQIPYSNVSTNYSLKRGALRVSLAALLLTSVASYVTTTTGGFDPASLEEQAVIDYSRLALAYFEAGELVSARRNANNALALDGAAASLEVLVLISQREQDYGLAEEYFRLALRKAPQASRIRNNCAAFLFERARYSEAYVELQSVVADTGYAGRAEACENLGLTSLESKNTA